MHERIAELSCNALHAADAAEATERIAAHGFDTVLARDIDTHDLRDPTRLAAIAHACRIGGLALWVVVGPDATGAPLFNAQASPPLDPWLIDSDAALDPRRPPVGVDRSPFPIEGIDVAAWRARIDDALAAGVAGFVCRDADRLPDALWSTLTGPPARWIAWTPGLSGDRVARLADLGFDTVCSSLAWWDGRGRWLIDELTAAPRVMTLTFPSDPFSPAEDESTLPADVRLRLAALLGDALLLPQSVWDDVAANAPVAAINQWFAQRPGDARPLRQSGLRQVTGTGSPLTALVVAEAPDLRGSTHARVALINPDRLRAASIDAGPLTTTLAGFAAFEEILAAGPAHTLDPCTPIALEAGACRLFTATRLPAIERALPTGRRSTDAALKMPRLAIEAITPSVDDGRFPVKRTAGEAVRVEADIVIDGHEQLAAALLYRAAGETAWHETRMEAIGNDRYAARFPLARVGRHEFTIEAWRDVFASYRHELDKKSAAGLDVTLELTEGRLLVEQAVERAQAMHDAALAKRLAVLAKSLAHTRALDQRAMATRVAALLASQTLADMQAADAREFAYRPAVLYPVDAERIEASFASWYELFPRSLGNAPGQPATHHGRFDDVIDRLPAVKAMGFDVLYFPPIHPIGKRNRKGRNNSLTALEDDPGSPYAIGSADGGHDALHPELGTFDDFRRMRDAALEHGLELALDFAIQCSPDHPWLKDHPGWFAWRPDGSLRYAENPPKKYEDIVNVDFYGEGRGKDAATALWAALRDVILLWVEQGVRIFRVDNPHTKPLPFWEWMIGEVRAKHPDVIFLSEAFTRPKPMYRLAKIGFSQSYTYFTWRHTNQEFIDYVTELTTTSPRDFFRPNFFVNTPDINPVFLQRSGRAGFLIRAALASLLSGLWGVYSGFELCEATPVPGKEDYLDSEKYQLRAWDWQRPGHIIGEITALNRIRRENPALRTHLNTRFEVAHDPNLLYFTKATDDLSNVLLVAINLDPFGVHEADFEIPLWRWGKPDDASVDVTDLIDGHGFRWTGKFQRMRLDPAINPYAIWRVAL